MYPKLTKRLKLTYLLLSAFVGLPLVVVLHRRPPSSPFSSSSTSSSLSTSSSSSSSSLRCPPPSVHIIEKPCIHPSTRMRPTRPEDDLEGRTRRGRKRRREEEEEEGGEEEEEEEGRKEKKTTAEMTRQRNELSRLLHRTKKELSLVECEERGNETRAVSSSGGWCRSAALPSNGHHKTDYKLATALGRLFQSRTVASFGDGPGIYRKVILNTGHVTSFASFDGSPFVDEISGGEVVFLDLTLPAFGIGTFDWVLSLEVAEHIPSKFENIFLDNLSRHAGYGIVLSWAEPNQPGLSHVNNQPASHVIEAMSRRGFRLDEELSNQLRRSASVPWLRRNVNVFLRRTDAPLDPRMA